jgi:hypothetical protein
VGLWSESVKASSRGYLVITARPPVSCVARPWLVLVTEPASGVVLYHVPETGSVHVRSQMLGVGCSLRMCVRHPRRWVGWIARVGHTSCAHRVLARATVTDCVCAIFRACMSDACRKLRVPKDTHSEPEHE